MRTFSVERIRAMGVLDEHFEPRALPTEPFPHSMGVHSGIRVPFKSSSTRVSRTTSRVATGTGTQVFDERRMDRCS